MRWRKKAVEKLRGLGVERLEIEHSPYGYWVADPGMDIQSPAQFHCTAEEAIQAAVNGEVPYLVERIT